MSKLNRRILELLVAGTSEPLLVARIDHPDWPVVLTNTAFETLAGQEAADGQPLADVVENLVGRELALEISENVRGGHETSIAVTMGSREYLLVLRPLRADSSGPMTHYAVHWRSTSGTSGGSQGEMQQALLKAKRRIRDLTRDDPVTGLLNTRTFREVLAHDWAVAAREKTSLALVAFTLDDFDAYVEVFGRHASDSCLRRVAQAIRRCLRRASDVAARVEGDTGDYLVVLSHSSDESAVNEFAGRISAAVRELGLHHPRSSRERFVTVSYKAAVKAAGTDKGGSGRFLNSVL